MFNQVNEYCLNRIVQLSESREVVAAEDICDEHGMKLLAKGKRVSPELQQRLLQRKLARPLEVALSVDSAASLVEVVDSCFEQLDQQPLAKCFAGTQDAMALLRTLKTFKLTPPVRLLLTAIREHSPKEYAHNINTILLAVGIASRLRANDHDAMVLMLAGLLHDFGLLYVNPELVKLGNRLEPRDWKYVAAHPVIGQLLLKELTALPPIVGECTAQHHERLDGSGYPNHLNHTKTQRLSAWLAVADSVSAIMVRGGEETAARIALALRVVPEEFDREAVSSVLQAMNGLRGSQGRGDDSCFARAEQEMDRLQEALALVHKKIAFRHADPMAQAIAQALEITLGNVAKSLRATGVLDAREQLAGDIGDAELLAEMNQITHEVGWRMRNLARNIHLRTEAYAGGKLLGEFQEVIEVLNRDLLAEASAGPVTADDATEVAGTPADIGLALAAA